MLGVRFLCWRSAAVCCEGRWLDAQSCVASHRRDGIVGKVVERCGEGSSTLAFLRTSTQKNKEINKDGT